MKQPSLNHRMWARWSDAGTLETTVLTSVLALAVAGGVFLVVQTYRGLGSVPAVGDDAHHGQVIVACGFLAFILGRLAHLVRRRRTPQWESPRPGMAALTHTGLLLFFAAGVLALGYEAIGLWAPPGGDSGVSPWGIHPITHYVRYAKEVAPWPAGIVAVVVSFLVGHWLWPPSKAKR